MPAPTKARKGYIGDHGKCKRCDARLSRKHNRLWCGYCLTSFDLKRNPEKEEKE